MNKYQIIRESVESASKKIIGKTVEEAKDIVKAHGLTYRFVVINGKGSMITADCKSDRIGFVIDNNIVIAVHNG